jgi:hypothetical protein
VWDHWLILPYLGAATVLLVIGCRRDGDRRRWLVLVAAATIGALPLIIYNVNAASGQDSISVFRTLNGGDTASLGTRLLGGVVLGVPLSTGVCHPGNCTGWERRWPLLFLVLLVAAGIGAAVAARREPDPAQRLRHWSRLALVLAAVASIVAYARSPAAATSPMESARYLSCLPVSLAAAVWPLWRGASIPRAGVPRSRMARLRPLASAGILVVMVATMVQATYALARSTHQIGTQATHQRQLIQTLERLGITDLYSEYWTCSRLAYATGEHIACAVVQDDLRPGWDRYPPLLARVRAAARPAYAFPVGSAANDNFRAHLVAAGSAASVVTAAGYDIYRLPTPVDVPLPLSTAPLGTGTGGSPGGHTRQSSIRPMWTNMAGSSRGWCRAEPDHCGGL